MSTIYSTVGTSLLEQSLPSSWQKWTYFNDYPKKDSNGVTMTGPSDPDGIRPFENTLPDKYYPFTDFRIGADIATSALDVTAVDMMAIGIGGGLPMATGIAMMAGTPSAMSIYWRSHKSSGILGNTRIMAFPVSPRIGYSIGNHFKHQSYLWMDLAGYGIAVMLMVNWLMITGYGGTEYCTNCRLKTTFLKHGLVESVRFEDIVSTSTSTSSTGTSQKYMFVKINSAAIPPGSEAISAFSGEKVKIYSPDTGTSARSKEYTVDSLNERWEVKVPITSGDEIYAKAGDFFIFEKSMIIEDPALIHEYNLSFDNEMAITSSQVRGLKDCVFEPLPPTTTTSTLATSPTTPGSAAPSTMATTATITDSTHLTFILKKGEKPGPCGGTASQNTCAHNLLGQFVVSGEDYYEITGHPRANIIEVLAKSKTTGTTLVNDKFTADIVQQKMWLTNEYYFGSSNTYGSVGGFCNGYITKIDPSEAGSSYGSKITWESSLAERKDTTLPGIEATRWGVKTLGRRYLKKIQVPSSSGVKSAFTKFAGWKISSSKKLYSVSTSSATSAPISVIEDPGGSALTVTASLSEKVDGVMKVGDYVYLLFDTPYPTLMMSRESATFSYVTATRGLGGGGRWTAIVNGYYDCGYRRMETAVHKDTVVSIVSIGTGTDAFGMPLYLASTKSRPGSISATYDNWPVPVDLVFYSGTPDNLMIMRGGAIDWKDPLTQKLVALGIGTSTPGSTSDSLNGGYYVNEIGFSGLKKDSYYWVVLNNGYDTFPYFSRRITGGGGISTPFSRRSSIPVSATPIINLPLDHYSAGGKKKDDGKLVSAGSSDKEEEDGKIVSSAFYKATANCSPKLELASSSKLSAIAAGASPAPAPTIEAEYKRYARRRELLTDVGIHDAHCLSNGNMYFVYGATCKEMAKTGASSSSVGDSENFKAAPCVYIILSENKGGQWGAGHLKTPISTTSDSGVPTPPSDAEINEWATPLMVLYDFMYAGSIVDKKGEAIWIFGYVYKRGHDGDKDYMYLACYSFFFKQMSRGKEGENVIKLYTVDGSDFVWLRQMGIDTDHGSKTTYLNTGGAADAVSSEFYTAGGGDSFCRIYGGKEFPDEYAAIQNMYNDSGPLFSYGDVISVSYDESLSLCMTRSDRGISSYSSSSRGESWTDPLADATEIKKIEGSCPLIHGDYLFYFIDETLMVKIGGGNGSNEIQTVAGNTLPQRIAATTDKKGITKVFFMTKNDILTCYYTDDKGDTWNPLTNW